MIVFRLASKSDALCHDQTQCLSAIFSSTYLVGDSLLCISAFAPRSDMISSSSRRPAHSLTYGRSRRELRGKTWKDFFRQNI